MKVAVICAYFGKLPDYLNYWLLTCEYNKDFDFFLVTDDDISFYIPPNVHVIKLTFDQLRKKVQKCFDFKISLERPYKLCDFKVAYGLIFREELKDYDFWGHCDLDQIFGDLSKFITESMLRDYDRIYEYGHLTLYRNNDVINNLFRCDGWLEYKKVFSNPIDFAFDEVGLRQILSKHTEIRWLRRMDGFDLSWTPYMEILNHCNQHIKSDCQAFFWKKGKTFQVSYENGKRIIREAAYIHFSHRKLMVPSRNPREMFYLAKDRLVNEDFGVPSINEIHELNPRPNMVKYFFEYETTYFQYGYYRRIKRKVRLILQRKTSHEK